MVTVWPANQASTPATMASSRLRQCRAKAGARAAAEKDPKDSGEWWSAPEKLITNGPYRIVAYTAGRGATLKTNPGYAGTSSGPAVIRLTFADTAEAGWALYQA